MHTRESVEREFLIIFVSKRERGEEGERVPEGLEYCIRMILTVYTVWQMCPCYESGKIWEHEVGEIYCKWFCHEEVWELEIFLCL